MWCYNDCLLIKHVYKVHEEVSFLHWSLLLPFPLFYLLLCFKCFFHFFNFLSVWRTSFAHYFKSWYIIDTCFYYSLSENVFIFPSFWTWDFWVDARQIKVILRLLKWNKKCEYILHVRKMNLGLWGYKAMEWMSHKTHFILVPLWDAKDTKVDSFLIDS
jgi:hypothetical protein